MKSLVRTFFSAVSIAALGLTASAALAQGAGEIVVYNAQHESLAKSWAEAFTADTGIKVVLRNGGDTQLGNQLVQEGAASSADVFLTENSPAMVLVDNAKLFAPVDPATLDVVPEEYRPSHGRWIGIAARSTVFVYDKRKLDQSKLPASIMDLADASCKGRWAASPSGADFQAIVSAILEIKGSAATQAWLTAMKQNSVVLRGNVAAMKAVNAGEVEGAVIYHYYWFGDQAKTGENSQNVGVHYFRNKDAGAFVSISGAGVLASSKNQPQAQAFLKWIVTKGQNILRTGNSYEYAVAKGAASNERLPPLVDLQAPKIDPAKLNSRAVSDMMTAAGLL
jgi:iron(III) transport system substrate-binding protein